MSQLWGPLSLVFQIQHRRHSVSQKCCAVHERQLTKSCNTALSDDTNGSTGPKADPYTSHGSSLAAIVYWGA
ncbi:MAG: hypothetical protein ACI8R4_004273, partial [Paracoccaceae bacterium]